MQAPVKIVVHYIPVSGGAKSWGSKVIRNTFLSVPSIAIVTCFDRNMCTRIQLPYKESVCSCRFWSIASA